MGACYSCHPVSHHCGSRSLTHLGSRLNTGDIVLLLDGAKHSPYLFRASSAGGWSRAVIVGFLVREGEGPTDLALYHADSRLPSGLDPHCQVVRTSLAEELASGRYTTAVVRRLYKPLSPTKGALVKEFAALNAGKVAPIEPACSVLMANASGHATTAYERLACSEFVAMMLHLVGLVEPTDIPGEFMAIAPKGRVCGPPLGIKLDKPTVLSSDPVSPAHGSAKSSSSREPSLSPRSSAGSISGSHSPLPLVGSPRAVAAPP